MTHEAQSTAGQSVSEMEKLLLAQEELAVMTEKHLSAETENSRLQQEAIVAQTQLQEQ